MTSTSIDSKLDEDDGSALVPDTEKSQSSWDALRSDDDATES